MYLLKRLSLLAAFVPAIITANNNPATPDMFAQMQQQMLAMQQQMLEMQNQLQQRDREIATLRSGQTITQPAASTVTALIPYVPQERNEEEGKRQELRPQVPTNSNARAPESMAIGEIPAPRVPSPVAQHLKKKEHRKSEEHKKSQKNEEKWTREKGLQEFLKTPLLEAAIFSLERMKQVLAEAKVFVPDGAKELDLKRRFVEVLRRLYLQQDGKDIHEETWLEPHMVNPKAMIDARAIHEITQADEAADVRRLVPKRGLIPLREALPHLHELTNHTALSLAAVAGNAELVEVMLETMLANLETKDDEACEQVCRQLYRALKAMLEFSRLLPTKYADVLLEHMGFVDLDGKLRKPSVEAYSAILKNMMAALRRLQPIRIEAKQRALAADVRMTAKDKEERLEQYKMAPIMYFMTALVKGSMPLVRQMMEQANNFPFAESGPLADMACGLLARGLISGEKVGLLLAFGGNRTNELIYKMGHGILKHVAINPKLLARLKREVVRQRALRPLFVAEINPHLAGVTVLSNIVVDYSNDELMLRDVGNQIMALQPMAEDRTTMHPSELLGRPAPESEPLEDTMAYIRNLEKQKEEKELE